MAAWKEARAHRNQRYYVYYNGKFTDAWARRSFAISGHKMFPCIDMTHFLQLPTFIQKLKNREK